MYFISLKDKKNGGNGLNGLAKCDLYNFYFTILKIVMDEYLSRRGTEIGDID